MISRLIAPQMRSTPLRLTGILILIFTLSSLIGFGFAYTVIRNNLDNALESQLEQAIESYASIADAGALQERLIADAATLDADMTIVLFMPQDGPAIGNVAGFPRISDLTIVSGHDIASDTDDLSESYLADAAPVFGGRLVVAQSREQIVEMGEVFSSVLLIGLLPTLLIAATAGLLVARRARDRVEAIRTTLQDLTHGTLTSRVPDVVDTPDDLEQIGLAVNRMAQAQAASIAAMKQVSDDIAHDLKTPIQRVAIQLSRLQDRTVLSDEQAAIVDIAVAETEGIVRTFQSLLQIAQIEGGSVRDRFVPVDLHQLAESMVEVFAPTADESGHVLTFLAEPDAPMRISGDRQLLGQVLVNLIENGLRHVPAGGRIDVSIHAERGGVALVVRDDGPGVPVDERSKVLRRLYRLERSRTSEGNGLGLSLVAAICDLHGAALTLDDAGPGLIVRIVFPLLPPTPTIS